MHLRVRCSTKLSYGPVMDKLWNKSNNKVSFLLTVLRLGHRRTRDQRMTTHVALVARAFGADEILVAGDEDASLEKSVAAVVKNWGGKFSIRHIGQNWPDEIERMKKKGTSVVHLTMYGERVQDAIADVRKHKNIVVIVGSQKVPPEAYRLADFNIAVGNQPHSEIAALAIFLDKYFNGEELSLEMEDGKKIVPSRFGKNVISCDKREQV